MNSKRTIPISEARRRIFEIANEIQETDAYYTLTENGKPKAVILSVETFEGLLDDLEIYSQPCLLKEIEKAEQEIARGECIKWEDLKKELGLGAEKRGLVMADEGKQKYCAAKLYGRSKKAGLLLPPSLKLGRSKAEPAKKKNKK